MCARPNGRMAAKDWERLRADSIQGSRGTVNNYITSASGLQSVVKIEKGKLKNNFSLKPFKCLSKGRKVCT